MRKREKKKNNLKEKIKNDVLSPKRPLGRKKKKEEERRKEKKGIKKIGGKFKKN